MTTVALADDHKLVRHALVELVNSIDGFNVILDVNNGQELLEELSDTRSSLPDLVLIDINMPIMDGYRTMEYMSLNFPQVKCMALSVEDSEEAIIRMLRLGAKGYLLKDTDTPQFKIAMEEVILRGFYHSELVSSTLLRSIKRPLKARTVPIIHFMSRELEFLDLVCTELTYKEIAEHMGLSPRTVDGYRDSLFEKLGVKSRTGLVMYAIKNSLVKV